MWKFVLYGMYMRLLSKVYKSWHYQIKLGESWSGYYGSARELFKAYKIGTKVWMIYIVKPEVIEVFLSVLCCLNA